MKNQRWPARRAVGGFRLPLVLLGLLHVVGAAGSVGAAPQFSARPSPMDFGSVNVGQSKTITLDVSNTGDGTFSVLNVSVSGGGFSISWYGALLGPGGEAFYDVKFQPLSAGPKSGTITISTETGDHTVSLTGTGVAPPTPSQLVVSPDPLDFGVVNLGSSLTLAFTLKNLGAGSTGTIAVSSNLYAADFTGQSSSVSPLAPGATTTWSLTFHPSIVGNLAGYIQFNDPNGGAGSDVVIVNVQGRAVAATGGLMPPTVNNSDLNFGSAPVGGPGVSKAVSLTNPNLVPIAITDVRILGGAAGDFQVGAYPPTIPAGFTAEVNVNFQPRSAGVKNSGLNIAWGAAGTTGTLLLVLDITGTGVTSTPMPTPTPTPTPTPIPTPTPTGPTITGYAATNPKGVRITTGPPGAPLLILGSNFGTGGSVAFNGIPAGPTVSWSAGEIVVIIPTPPSYPYSGPVTVTVSGQTATGPPFTILAPATPTPTPNPTPTPANSVDWPVFMHDPAQLGATSSLDPRTLSPWSAPVSSKPGGAPVVAGGVVYVGTEATGVFAIDAASHTQKWNRSLPAPVRSSLAAGTDVVAVSAGGLYGLNPKDGSDLWPARTDIVAADGVAPMRAGDTLFLGGAGPGGLGSAVYAVQAATGKDRWPQPALLPAPALSTAAVDTARGLLFVAVGQPLAAGQPPKGPSAVLALRVSDGTAVWPSPVVFADSPAPAGLSLGLVAGNGGPRAAVFVAAGNRVTALDESTGAQLWSRTLPESSLQAPPVVSAAAVGATLFVGGASGKVYALSANTGLDAPGEFTTPVAPLAGPPALAGSTLLIPTTTALVAADASGAKLWSSDLPLATGVAVASGAIYVGTADDRLAGFSAGGAPGTADVALTAIQVPSTVSRSSDALVKVTLVNRGAGSASYSLTLRVQPGNTLIGTTTGSLAAGETKAVPFTWGTAFMGADGVKVLLAQVDLVGGTDAHPEDNVLTQAVTVAP